MVAERPQLHELVDGIPHREFAVIVHADITDCTGRVKLAGHHGPMCELRCEECGYTHGARVEALQRALKKNQPREEGDLHWWQKY